jgi:DNA-binding MarR family transcriptional regulator
MRLAVLVLRFNDQVKQEIRDIGEEIGLSVAQLDVLRQLNAYGPTPMRRLATILDCEASNLTGLVDKLEGRGLVQRLPDPTDRRVRLLALTDEGRDLSHDTWMEVTRRSPAMNLPPEQRAALDSLLSDALRHRPRNGS